MNIMTYKGYRARIGYDDDVGIFFGHMVGVGSTVPVSFSADEARELRFAFHQAVDNYLEACARLGIPPKKPASGKITLRVSPELHQAVLEVADATRTSPNQWVVKVLDEAVRSARSESVEI